MLYCSLNKLEVVQCSRFALRIIITRVENGHAVCFGCWLMAVPKCLVGLFDANGLFVKVRALRILDSLGRFSVVCLLLNPGEIVRLARIVRFTCLF